MKVKVLKKQGKKPISFKEGSLHSQLGVPQGEKIPEETMQSAREGKFGALAKKRAMFAKNVLTGKK